MAKKERKPLTGAELEAFIATDVAYEIESLGAAIAVLRRAGRVSPEHRCAVEAFLVHARNLDQFLSRATSDYGSDVLAVDVGGWTPRTVLVTSGVGHRRHDSGDPGRGRRLGEPCWTPATRASAYAERAATRASSSRASRCRGSSRRTQ